MTEVVSSSPTHGENKGILGDVLTSSAMGLREFLPRKGNGVNADA